MTTFQRDGLLDWGLKSLAAQKLAEQGVDILVLNDGHPGKAEELCRTYGARYLHTGPVEGQELNWRIPGYALNIGAKISEADFIILTCAEMFHVDEETVLDLLHILEANEDTLAIPQGKNDVNGHYLTRLIESGRHDLDRYQHCANLKVHLPFFLGVKRDYFIDIGGYDEDFTGQAWDDNDIVDRLQLYGCEYAQSDSRVVHLYHPRAQPGRELDMQHRWAHNKQLYDARRGVLVRNIGSNWGTL